MQNPQLARWEASFILHFVLRCKKSDELSNAVANLIWKQDNVTTRCDLEKRTPNNALGEDFWYAKVDAEVDPKLSNSELTDLGNNEHLSIELVTQTVNGHENRITMSNTSCFVSYFIINKKAEFVLLTEYPANDGFCVIPVMPVTLYFQVNTDVSVQRVYQSHPRETEFNKSRLHCSNCTECRRVTETHCDKQVWMLDMDVMMAYFNNDTLLLPNGDNMRVQLRVVDGQEEVQTDINVAITPSIYSGQPTQTFLINLGLDLRPVIYPVVHIELHFFCELTDAQGFQLKGNCQELEFWKKTLTAVYNDNDKSSFLNSSFLAAIVDIDGSMLLKTFDLEDFQFEVLILGLELWPKVHIFHRFQVSLEPFSVFKVEITKKVCKPILSIEPVIYEVKEKLNTDSQNCSAALKTLVPQLRSLGQLINDPQNNHDIWGEDLPGEVEEQKDRNLWKAKSGLEYIKLRHEKFPTEKLSGRRTVIKRLGKKYHSRQELIVAELLNHSEQFPDDRKEKLEKMCKGLLSITDYEAVLQGLTQDYLDKKLQLRDQTILRHAAAIVRGRTEAIILSPRCQKWERDNWDQHMKAIVPWFKFVLALNGSNPLPKAIEEDTLNEPIFYSW